MNRRSLLKKLMLGLAAVATGGGGVMAYASGRNRYYSGPVTDHFDGTRFFVPGVEFENSFGRLLKWQMTSRRAVWPKSFPSPHADEPPQQVAKGELRVTLIGHASFLLQADGKNILIDPVYSQRVSPVSFAGPKRVNPPGIAFDKLPRIDVVLVTHGHYDHLDVDTLARLQKAYAPHFITPLGNDSIIASAVGQSAKITAKDWGDSLDLPAGIRVHFEPSYHWSARGITDRRKQLWCSFVIETTAGKIYHIGDTGYINGQFFRDVKAKHGALKLAVIPIGAYEPRWFMKQQHVNPEESVRIMQDCGAEMAIGHHWGTFQLTNEAIEDPPTHLAQALASAGIDAQKFKAFRPGQVLKL